MLLREVDYSKNAEIVNLGIVWVLYVCVRYVLFFSIGKIFYAGFSPGGEGECVVGYRQIEV